MRVGINGLGRIGRGLFKALWGDSRFEVAAINDVAEADVIAHLLNHDSYYGPWIRRAETGDHGAEDLLVGDAHLGSQSPKIVGA